MTKDALDLFSIAQGGLAIVGFIALSAWIVRWSSLFFAKHRELSELDKDINLRLRDALELERKQSSLDRDKLQHEASQAIERLAKAELNLNTTQEMSKSVRSALHLAIGASTTMLTEVGRSQLEAHILDVREFALALRACHIAPSDNIDWLARSPSDVRSPPSDPKLATLYLANRIVHRTYTINALATCIATAAPTALTFVTDNPRASRAEIAKAMAAEIRGLPFADVEEHIRRSIGPRAPH